MSNNVEKEKKSDTEDFILRASFIVVPILLFVIAVSFHTAVDMLQSGELFSETSSLQDNTNDPEKEIVSSVKLKITDAESQYSGSFSYSKQDFKGKGLTDTPLLELGHETVHELKGSGEVRTGRSYKIFPYAWNSPCDVEMILKVTDVELLEVDKVANKDSEELYLPAVQEKSFSRTIHYNGTGGDHQFDAFRDGFPVLLSIESCVANAGINPTEPNSGN